MSKRQQNFDGAKGHYFNYASKGVRDWEIAQKAINSPCKGSKAPAEALSKGKAITVVKAFRRVVIGKPNDRKGHVRFDEGMAETLMQCVNSAAVLLYQSTVIYSC
jgi:hypothetical protein